MKSIYPRVFSLDYKHPRKNSTKEAREKWISNLKGIDAIEKKVYSFIQEGKKSGEMAEILGVTREEIFKSVSRLIDLKIIGDTVFEKDKYKYGEYSGVII